VGRAVFAIGDSLVKKGFGQVFSIRVCRDMKSLVSLMTWPRSEAVENWPARRRWLARWQLRYCDHCRAASFLPDSGLSPRRILSMAVTPNTWYAPTEALALVPDDSLPLTARR